jgi:hypothetical protein
MEIAHDWILHHDNAPAARTHTHTASSVREFLPKKCIPLLTQAPHSPDLSPCDFYLFPKLKPTVKSYHFQTLDRVQKAVADAIKILTEADFQSRYEARKTRWDKCVASEGCCFERGNFDLEE